MISPLAYIDPSAKLGKNCIVHPFAYIDKNVEIGDNNEIMPYASLMSGTRMGNGNKIYQGAVVSAVPQDFHFKGEETFVRIGNNNVIRENATIARGTHAEHDTIVGSDNFIMQSARLSHDVEVGSHVIVGNGSQVSGYCCLDDYSILTSHVLMQGNTRLGKYAMVQSGCRFTKDIPPFTVVAHEPAIFSSVNVKVLERWRFTEKQIRDIAQAYYILYKSNVSNEVAIKIMQEQIHDSHIVDEIVAFIRRTKVGLING